MMFSVYLKYVGLNHYVFFHSCFSRGFNQKDVSDIIDIVLVSIKMIIPVIIFYWSIDVNNIYTHTHTPIHETSGYSLLHL